MGWKSVAWASCLLPVLAGCSSLHNPAAETWLDASRVSERDLRKEAHFAWHTARGQDPWRAFTDEFHDGFLDGYVDCREYGPTVQPPGRPFKYRWAWVCSTSEGGGRLRRYQLGFKYGSDAALVNGGQEPLTAPGVDGTGRPKTPVQTPGMTQPNPIPAPRPVPDNKFGPPKKSDDPPSLGGRPSLPTSPGPGISPPPKPTRPTIPPFNPDLPGGGKFAPLPVPPDPDLLPVPNPPLPSASVTPLPVPTEPVVPIPPVLGQVPVMKVPLTPASVPLPFILDDIPVIPFRLTASPPTPVSSPPPQKP